MIKGLSCVYVVVPYVTNLILQIDIPAEMNETSNTTSEITTNLAQTTEQPTPTTDLPTPTTGLPVSNTEDVWTPFPAGDALNDPWFKKINFCFSCYDEAKLVSII